ncbi:MAG: uroporphyrinogen decarboxylase family protein [gamma proteobacterium symbiont of Taylorina sp.]|nr:uroporphyrinogen decarboxylase family protein [gamma proteobacterium symbiont of Taylorina sp.]
MSHPELTSMQRVLTTLGYEEPDRVPWFLFVTMHGAKELGLSIEDYFKNGKNVAEGQIRMQQKYEHDCYYNIFYLAAEMESIGGSVIYRDDGPPNAGRPMINDLSDIEALTFPDPSESENLSEVLEATRIMKEEAGDSIPIIGVVLSPFSSPIIQMGLDAYINLIENNRKAFDLLMSKNEAFCAAWANAQLNAGATAIGYFDPFSSNTMIPPDLYRETGLKVAKRTIANINGPTATHFASGRCEPIIDDIASTGTALIGVTTHEDMSKLKKICNKRMSVLGNLNGIEMRHWTPEQAEENVKLAIASAAKGGGFILSDNHGEIPWQVSEDVLLSISKAVKKWGRYPLEWIDNE